MQPRQEQKFRQAVAVVEAEAVEAEVQEAFQEQVESFKKLESVHLTIGERDCLNRKGEHYGIN